MWLQTITVKKGADFAHSSKGWRLCLQFKRLLTLVSVDKGADFDHSSKGCPRQRELKAAGLTRAQQQGEPKTEGTEGCWANLGHSSKESPRQTELKAAGLTWGTAARRAQDRRN